MDESKDIVLDILTNDLEPKHKEIRKSSNESDVFKKWVASILTGLEANPVVTKYELDSGDLKIATFLIQNSFEGKKSVGTRAILKMADNEFDDCLKGLHRLWELEKKGIIVDKFWGHHTYFCFQS